MGITVKWDVTYKCNLNCAHCINGELLGNVKDEINSDDFKRLILDIKEEYPIDYLHMLGGEPTVRKDFLELCSILEENNIGFGFNTNSLLLNDETCNKLSMNKSLEKIVFSIEGPNAEINDEIRGKRVFHRIVSVIETIDRLRVVHNNQRLKLVVNIVLSKKNREYIDDMIDFCLDRNIDTLNILSLIEKGNAKDSNLSLTDEENLEVIDIIADRFEGMRDRLSVVPKFIRPLAKDYARIVLDKDFPEVYHGCGAGINFVFLNNKGEVFPCDRYALYGLHDDANYTQVKSRSFKDIWSSEGFSRPFAILESSTYREKYPCKNCKYFASDCFPCPLEDVNKTINGCELFMDLIREKELSSIRPVKHTIRISDAEGNQKSFINTGDMTTIKLNDVCSGILEGVMDRSLSDYSSLKDYAEKNEIEPSSLYEFLEFLKEKRFIDFGV